MTSAAQERSPDEATRLIESIQVAEQSALESVRKFVDTVDGMFPDAGEDGPRRKVIDSAFKMVEEVVGTANQLARNVVKVTESALSDVERNTSEHKSQ